MRFALATLFLLFTSAMAAAQPAPATMPSTMVIDKQKKTITIACKIAPRKLEYLTDIYPIEVIATLPHPRGKKAHETVVNYDIVPSQVHQALMDFGLKPGKPVKGEGVASGPEVRVSLEIPDSDGGVQIIPIEKTLVDKRTRKTMPLLKWFFTGSAVHKDPDTGKMLYGANDTGTLVGIFPVTDDLVIQSDLTIEDEPYVKMETNKKILPPEGTPVKLIIQVK